MPQTLLKEISIMSKHTLYKSQEEDLDLNTSLDETDSPETKKKSSEARTKTSKSVKRDRRCKQKNSSRPCETLSSASEDEGHISGSQKEEHCKASTSKAKESSSKKNQIHSDNESPFIASENDSRSDSDSTSADGFFSSSNQKLPYSFEEDEEIVKYVLKGQGIFRVGSILLWRHLEQKRMIPKRSFQSMKNRFLRNIKPHLFTTYRHLIPDEETIQKILIKFPELKKKLGKKETLSKIKLPDRETQQSEKKLFKIDMVENRSNSEYLEDLQEQNSEASQAKELEELQVHFTEPTEKAMINFNTSLFRRRVFWNNNSISVSVNFNFSGSVFDKLQGMGMYEKYFQLKEQNKLTPCPHCGLRAGPDAEKNLDSDAESDVFISNSVESKKGEKNFSEKRLLLRKTKSYKRRRNSISGPLNHRSCSPSLLNDVNEVVELDEGADKNDKAVDQVEEVSHSEIAREEADSTPGESSALTNTDTIYQNTMAEFRKLIDSDEEEILVNKCLKKSMKTIGLDPNLSVNELHVDSFFIKTNSSEIESATPSDAIILETETSETIIETGTPGLIQNMVRMLENTRKT